jgi:hypothetical protein
MCDWHRTHEPSCALSDKDMSGATKRVRIVSARVLLLIALLAPVVMIAAGIASRRRDPAGTQNDERENSDAGRPIQS